MAGLDATAVMVAATSPNLLPTRSPTPPPVPCRCPPPRHAPACQSPPPGVPVASPRSRGSPGSPGRRLPPAPPGRLGSPANEPGAGFHGERRVVGRRAMPSRAWRVVGVVDVPRRCAPPDPDRPIARPGSRQLQPGCWGSTPRSRSSHQRGAVPQQPLGPAGVVAAHAVGTKSALATRTVPRCRPWTPSAGTHVEALTAAQRCAPIVTARCRSLANTANTPAARSRSPGCASCGGTDIHRMADSPASRLRAPRRRVGIQRHRHPRIAHPLIEAVTQMVQRPRTSLAPPARWSC